jgi:peptidoglycan/LPS O-acetylase OafA/YrhL
VSRSLFRFFGNASYPLYVIHMPLLVIYVTVLAHFGLPRNLPALLCAAPPMVLAGWAIDRYFDPWARDLMRRLPRRSGTPKSPASAKAA